MRHVVCILLLDILTDLRRVNPPSSVLSVLLIDQFYHIRRITRSDNMTPCHLMKPLSLSLNSARSIHPIAKRACSPDDCKTTTLTVQLLAHSPLSGSQKHYGNRGLCPFCNKFFNAELNMHVKAVHLKVKQFGCRVCGVSFTHRYTRWKHERDVHKMKKS